jgi:HEAT repeat protein
MVGWLPSPWDLSQSYRSCPALIERLDDQDIKMKQACLWALSRIRSHDANLFISFLHDKDPELVRLAIGGLNLLGTPEASEALNEFQ